MVDQDSVVGIVTCCRLDSSGLKFRRGQNFPHLSGQALGPTYWFFLGVKWLGHGVDHQPPSGTGLKEKE